MKLRGDLDRFKDMRIISFLFLTLAVSLPALAADRVEREITASASGADVRTIVIEIPSSSLTINTAPQRVVRVEGKASRTYRGEHNRASAERLLEEAEITTTLRGRTLYIERDLGPRGSRFWNSPNATQFHLTLTLPAGVPVELRQNAGTIDLDGSFGDLDVRLGAGDLTLRMPRTLLGELDAGTTVGELKTDLGPRVIEKSGVMAGSTTFLNPEGSVKVRLRVRAGAIDVRLTD